MAYYLPARLKLLAATLLCLGLVACAEQNDPEPGTSAAAEPPIVSQTPETPADTGLEPSPGSDWAAATLSSCYARVQRFRTSTNALARQADNFHESPDSGGLTQLQSRWRDTLETWGDASLCLAAPLPDASGRQMRDRLAVTAAAPALPGYLDRMPAYPNSGLIMDETVPISLKSLLRQHQITDRSEVSLGIYALEIILFGAADNRQWQDFRSGSPDADFQPEARRARVLRLQTEHLAGKADEWVAYLERSMARREAGQMPAGMESLLALFDRRVAEAADELLALSRGRPGLALQPEHDRLHLKGLVSHLSDWWQLSLSRAAALECGISTERWQDVAALLDSENTDGLPSHQDMQQVTAVLLRLRNEWARSKVKLDTPPGAPDDRERADTATD